MLDSRLETFLAVCDTMNYHKTADFLHISQPAVTQHIQYLEREYGCKLFRYENRRLQKTPAATVLEQYAREQKRSEEQMRRRMQNLEIRQLTVGVTEPLGTCLMSPYAEDFIRCEANELTLVTDRSDALLRLLDQSRLDFALVEGPFDRERYGHVLLHRETVVGICRRGHSFAGMQVEPEKLLEETVLLRETGCGTRETLEARLREFDKSLTDFRRCMEIGSASLIFDCVHRGIGISFVPEILARQEDMDTFTLIGGELSQELHGVFRKDSGAEEKIRRFLAADEPEKRLSFLYKDDYTDRGN